MGDATQRVSPHRHETTFDTRDIGKSRRHQNGLIDRTAHRRNATCLVNRRPYDGKVQPLAASDIAVEDFADMQTEIHLGYWLVVLHPPLVQFNDALACSDCRR